MTSIIDTHCHLDFSAFDVDRNAVLSKCIENHVSDIVVPAVSQATWPTTIELCAQHSSVRGAPKTSVPTSPQLHLALGLHPIFIEQHQPQHLTQLNELVKQHKPIAIGEIGLDYYQQKVKDYRQEVKDPAAPHTNKTLDKEKQTAFFSKQLIIAKQHALPVIIHNRKAHDECIKLLTEISVIGGIIHNFSGSIQHAHKYIDMGFKLGFGGMLTFERSRIIRSLAKQIPIESIVLETDAPDLTVEAHKGKRNSPEYLPFVLHALAEIKDMPAIKIAAITTQNAKQALQLSEPLISEPLNHP